MLVYYNSKENQIGLAEPGWNYVVTVSLVWACSADGRMHSTYISDVQPVLGWVFVGLL